MKSRLQYFVIVAMLALLTPAWSAAQVPVFELEIGCDENSSEYMNATYRAHKSDGFCKGNTEVRHYLSGDTEIVKSVRTTLHNMDDSGLRVKVEVEWEENKTGTVEIKVETRYRKYKSRSFTCEWIGWDHLYTYEITREGQNPGGSLEGENVFVSNGSQTVQVDLNYTKGTSYPYDVDQIQVKIDGQSRNDGIGTGDGSSIPLNYSFEGDAFGDHTFTTEVRGSCDEWMTGPQKTISIYPSCWQDNAANARLVLTGAGTTVYDDGIKVQSGTTYTIIPEGITDFDSHYEFVHDGGDNITLSGHSFTVHVELGSFRIEAVRKGERGLCPVVPALTVFTGGQNVTIEQECLITLPGTLIDFGYDLVPEEPALNHFAATIRSKRGIVVKPGIILSMGAELILDYEEPAIDESELNPDMNFIQATSYDEYGRVTSQSRQYFDGQGKAIQSQYKVLDKDVLMATQTLYDAYGRAVINTLPAPVASGTLTVKGTDCGDQLQTGEKVRFAYKRDFVTTENNELYTYFNFDTFSTFDGIDIQKEENPDPVGNTEEGTLGWYYSANNGTSLEEKLNEPLVATTNYPYSRTLFHHDGAGDVKSTTSPGDAFRAGGGHLTTMDKDTVTDSDSYLQDYLNMRSSELGLSNPATYQGNFFKNVVIDTEGRKSISYQDKGGANIISLYFGKQSNPITRSYQFYNDKEQLVVSLTPNGWNQYTGTNFSEVDKTEYTYNAKGRLEKMEETDAGLTQYVYRRDGSIRFSQNAEQEEDGRFSYTNYDRSGRPVESGEYVPGENGVTFLVTGMDPEILESLAPDGGLQEGMGTKRDRVFTYYDEPDSELPFERIQRFVQGAVSYTRKEGVITTWYSYDEQGRVEWMIQDIEGLGLKTVNYRYGPSGAIQEVAYQKGVPDEDFYHFYSYNADGQLLKVSTSTEELHYNRFGELTNPGALQQQAAYQYYLHGPLKRVELADKLQGIDYVYTANGALKGINHADINLDPGQDGIGNDFREDVFGMTLDYYANDYQGADYNAGSLSLSGVPEQYSGNIRAQSWHSPVDGGKPRTYAYSYDERFQLEAARWGNLVGGNGQYSFDGQENNAFQENIPAYDLNGNIEQLQRKGEAGESVANFRYDYKSNSNQLEKVQHNGESFREYGYNKIGQMQSQVADEEAMHLQYDVSGKVLGVYKHYNSSTDEYTEPIVLYTYDDRGFRLSKTSYDEEGNELPTNWYVRDASGSILSVYTEDHATDALSQAELPIYGAGKIGLYRPNALMNKHMYEVTDHLRNVRAVIGEAIEVEYLATMESERTDVEERYFESLHRVPTSDFINHTPPAVQVNGTTHAIENPNEVIRINNALDNPKKVIGGAIRLPVEAGDTIRAEVFAKYANFEKSNTNILPGLADYLSTAFVMPGGTDGIGLMSEVFAPGSVASLALAGASEDQPRAFLNYILFDKRFVLQDFGLVQVSEAAEITDELSPIASPHELLPLEVPISKSGYIYIYVSNDDGQNMDVYFDDFKVTHTYGEVVAGADYYPFGLAMEGREIDREDYRFGYQGEFAEKDEETGWNHFELRQYDPVVGRFISVDPMRQFASPYVGMGNNPVIGIDPSGGKVYNPIYDINNGNFLGTDDRGLQGEAIYMDPDAFVQNMAHSDVMKFGFTYDQLSGMNYDMDVLLRGRAHFVTLPSRPDYDGIVTDMEARAWWQSNSGDPLFVDVGQLDLTPLTTSSFNKKDGKLQYNFFTSLRTDQRTGRVHGTLSMRLRNANTGEVGFFRDGNGFFDTYDFNGDGRVIRDITTWGARQVVGEGTGFGFIPYGRNPRVPIR